MLQHLNNFWSCAIINVVQRETNYDTNEKGPSWYTVVNYSIQRCVRSFTTPNDSTHWAANYMQYLICGLISSFEWIMEDGLSPTEGFLFSCNFNHMLSTFLKQRSLLISPIGGGEYHNLHTFFQKLRILLCVSCSHTRQQNGVAERKHRHETGLNLPAHASVPFCYWSDGFTIACW
jgi:hypothetical protein